MMIFAFVAVFVGAFIINNTFSITVAQRTREMAMLRAIGASGRQVQRSVLIEAATVGVLASAAGLAAGIGGRIWTAVADVGVRVQPARRPDGRVHAGDAAVVRRRCRGDRALRLVARAPSRTDRSDRGAARRQRRQVRRFGPARRRRFGRSRPPASRPCSSGSPARCCWSASARWRSSSVCRCSAPCWLARSPRRSECHCACVGSAVSWPLATRCATRSAPLARRRR